MAAVAALVGDPGRANMLALLLDGRAHTATELADAAGVGASPASGHLARLVEGELVEVAKQGRHRYYRLASAEVARMLEGIMVVAAEPAPTRRATLRIDPELRAARTCYDHLAGKLGVAIADALVNRGAVRLTGDAAEVTERGDMLLEKVGMGLRELSASRAGVSPLPRLERATPASRGPAWRRVTGAPPEPRLDHPGRRTEERYA